MRIPPQDLEAEAAALANALQSKESLSILAEKLIADDFYKKAHRHIFEAIIVLENSGESVDVLTVGTQLEKSGKLAAIGGAYYLAEIMEKSPIGNAESYCLIVADKSRLRKIIDLSTAAIESAYKLESPSDIVNEVESGLLETVVNSTVGYQHIGGILYNAIEDIEAGNAGNVRSFIPIYDQKTKGFKGGEFIILAGRPGQGKTAFALTMAYHMATNNIPCGFVSLEMKSKELVKRIISMAAKVDGLKMRDGKLDDMEWQKISSVSSQIAEMPIHIDDASAQTVAEIRSKARRLKIKHDISCLFVDYMGLIKTRGYSNQNDAVTYISSSMKNLAKELDIPVFGLSQMSRKVENGPFRWPVPADLRDSGSLEQDADFIQFVIRPGYRLNISGEPEISDIDINGRNYKTDNLAVILQAKARSGSENIFMPFQFFPQFTYFAEFDLFHDESPVKERPEFLEQDEINF